MFIRTSAAFAAAAFLAGHAAAKTDIAGCVSSQTVAYGGASLIWYVPGTGEICEFLDCGGGRAPPKTTVPGCAAYEGTATYSPSYLPGFGATATPTSSSAEIVATSSSAETVATSSSAPEESSSSEPASASASASASSSSSSSKVASITSPPATILTGTVTSSAAVETHTGSSSDVTSSSTPGSGSVGSSTSSTPTNGAALPTAAVKGAFGMIAGLAMGVAML
ncbi:hypothetical protein F4782DRAFT_192972 [Xylaria castorea]|nr:hypothetical protein F4782DRAFT_192972 [Xylaria castorea]